jgi:hypothetical protein
MKNEKTQVPDGTIQLDKLVFSCTSSVLDNFDKKAKTLPSDAVDEFTCGKTEMKRIKDINKRYNYTYEVKYNGKPMGRVDFEPCNKEHYLPDRIKFSVDNTVFYNDTGKYLQQVLDDLHLQIENFSKIDIAVDSYTFNPEEALRLNLTKGNRVKLLRKFVDDNAPDKILEPVLGTSKPSLNNYYAVRGAMIKNKKGLKVYEGYDKMNEINYKSKKYYILDYHKRNNPKLEHLYRAEIRLSYEPIVKLKNKVEITLDKLLFDPGFLCGVFEYEVESVISIQDRHLQKIPLYQKITWVEYDNTPFRRVRRRLGGGSNRALESIKSLKTRLEMEEFIDDLVKSTNSDKDPVPMDDQAVETPMDIEPVPMDNDPVAIYMNPFISSNEYYLNNMVDNIPNNIMIDEYYLNNMGNNLQDNIMVDIDMVPVMMDIQQADPVKRKRVSFKRRRMMRNAEKKLRFRKRYAKKKTVKGTIACRQRGDNKGGAFRHLL